MNNIVAKTKSTLFESCFFSIPHFKWGLLVLCCSLHVISIGQDAQEVVIPGLYSLPETGNQNISNAETTPESTRADLHKFMGYEILLARYLSIPYDVNIKSNVASFFTDVGFLLIIIFPILFLISSNKINKNEQLKYSMLKLLSIIGLSIFLIISVASSYMNRYNQATPEGGLNILATSTDKGPIIDMNEVFRKKSLELYKPFYSWIASVSGEQDYVTYPVLIVLFTGILLLVYFRVRQYDKLTRSVILFLLVYFYLWWVLGSGAAWYGMLLFCLPYIFIAKAIHSKNIDNLFSFNAKNMSFILVRNSIVVVGCLVWLSMAVAFRFANYMPMDDNNAKNVYFPSILNYQFGKTSEKELLNQHMPKFPEISAFVNSDEKTLVYRVGTSLNYFVKKNDRRVFNDTFLSFFENMVSRFKTKEKIIQALRASGFKYIVFDLNLATNDFTPEKSLTRKFTQFLNTLYNNPEVELLITDRTIKLNSNSNIVYGVFEDQGTIVNRGSIALFRIK